MKYAFRWRERAIKQLRAIPQPSALTILGALTSLGDDPRRTDADVKKLAGCEDRYRLRVGDFRVIYEVVDGQLIILVVGVGHRREIYRTLGLGTRIDMDRPSDRFRRTASGGLRRREDPGMPTVPGRCGGCVARLTTRAEGAVVTRGDRAPD